MQDQSVDLINTPNYQQIKQNFFEELVRASQHKPSSIFFLKHHLPEKPLMTKGIVQGIVIGGTNYILSTEEIKSDGYRKIVKRETGVLPTFATKRTFINFLSKHLDSQAEAIGINFGFPLEANTGLDGELDGVLLGGTKEHVFKGLLHIPLGQLIKELFQNKYKQRTIVSIANDTVCLTLAGKGNEQGAFIAGTGFNMGLIIEENNKKIIVNLECGNFDKFTLSPTLEQIDKQSENPGGQLLEKAISGKYLAHYFNEKIKQTNLPVSPISTSQELSELSHTNHTDVPGDLARAIITRSAFLAGAVIAGVYEFSGKPKKFSLIGEGSLLWDGWQYHENIQKQLIRLGIPEGTVTIKHIKESSIKGAIGLLI